VRFVTILIYFSFNYIEYYNIKRDDKDFFAGFTLGAISTIGITYYYTTKRINLLKDHPVHIKKDTTWIIKIFIYFCRIYFNLYNLYKWTYKGVWLA